MIDTLRDGLNFVKQNGLRTVWGEFIKRDTHPLLQFVKYGCCGVLAVLVHTLVFGTLAKTVLPAMTESIVNGAPITKELLIRNFILASIVAFLVSNLTAYLTNLLVVFTGGRHHRVVEFLFFTAVSSVGFIVGLVIAVLQLQHGGEHANSWLATLTLVVTAALVNFACRKFFVFKG